MAALQICFLCVAYGMRELLSVYLHRKSLGMLVCPESDCEDPRKYLFKDLDGRALGLPPPVSVFPKTEAEWTGSFFSTGWLYLNLCLQYREHACGLAGLSIRNKISRRGTDFELESAITRMLSG